jgi:hypothetical protein
MSLWNPKSTVATGAQYRTLLWGRWIQSTIHFFKVKFINVFPSRFPSDLSPSYFQTAILYAYLGTLFMPHISHIQVFQNPNIYRGIKLWSILLYKFLYFTVNSPGNRHSSVCIATGYGLDDRGVGVRVPVESRIFSPQSSLDRLWGPPNLLSNGYRRLFPSVNHPGREADHSPPASAEVKKIWIYTPIPPYVFILTFLPFLLFSPFSYTNIFFSKENCYPMRCDAMKSSRHLPICTYYLPLISQTNLGSWMNPSN